MLVQNQAIYFKKLPHRMVFYNLSSQHDTYNKYSRNSGSLSYVLRLIKLYKAMFFNYIP